MKCPLLTLSSLLTVLALLVSAWAHGYAQAQPRAADLLSVVICADTGEETVHLDARGLPVAPEDCAQGLCPDCLPVPPLAIAAAGDAGAAPDRVRMLTTVAPGPMNAGHHHPAQLPRGPPALT